LLASSIFIDMSGAGSTWADMTSWADKARRAVAEQVDALAKPEDGDGDDPERGEAGSPQWASWAKGAAELVRQKTSEGLAIANEKANSAEWGGQAKAWSSDLGRTLGRVSDGAVSVSAGLSEKAKAASLDAQNKAALAAGSAKGALSSAGSSLGGMGDLMRSPAKLFQFAGIFMFGLFLISLSFSFLPLLPIQPQKFSLLFALGSLTVLGSVAWLKGPTAFLGVMVQGDKLPFSVLYAGGLVGSLWATLIARSYIFTAVFSFMQVVGLLYYLASFLPGGKVVLNFFGRLCGKLGGSALGSLMPWRK